MDVIVADSVTIDIVEASTAQLLSKARYSCTTYFPCDRDSVTKDLAQQAISQLRSKFSFGDEQGRAALLSYQLMLASDMGLAAEHAVEDVIEGNVTILSGI